MKACAPSLATTWIDWAVMSWPPDDVSVAKLGAGGNGGNPGGGGSVCSPLAATVSAPSTFTVIGPFENTELLTVRSAPAPSVAIEVAPMENQEPLIVIGPWFVTDAFTALRPLTFKLPVLSK